ncbi:MAG: elongation factor EF-2 [Candidatus Nanoarchaeia archaeon]|nr:elongation factor EF-2 [Candidatus Nanoarchaeia archaeon]
MADKETMADKVKRLMNDKESIRNVCTSAHIHHGKTAFTDNLIAAAGLMLEAHAGSLDEGMETWSHKDEQERLMTVDSANVSMVHECQGKEYIINLIDTPGHVDFGGDVTRAMRAVDGTFVLVCAAEGIMPQTETVLKQALRERVKPVLFINKVDRLITELRLPPEEIMKKIIKIIADFNNLIEQIAEPEFKQKWKVGVKEGSVAFGSARENWALSLPFMEKKKISFKDIYKIYMETEGDARKEALKSAAPLSEVMLDMVIKHHPNPIDAQKYRIPKIWHGDIESEFGKDLASCNTNGKVGFIITKIIVDKHGGGEFSSGRLFSGTLTRGMDVWLNSAKTPSKINNIFFYKGVKREPIDSITAGNIVAISGVNSSVGETITTEPQTPFEEISHIFEPVIVKAIEALNPKDLPKLVAVLRQVAKEDPSLVIDINNETGQHLIHGMGDLHLEIIENRIKTEKNVEIKTSEPIVVYRETVNGISPEVEGKSPNKHNKFIMQVEPVPPKILEMMMKKEIYDTKMKKNEREIWDKLEAGGLDRYDAKKVWEIFNKNLFIDNTKGIVHIGEVEELCIEAFKEVMKQGPMAREPGFGMIVRLTDTTLHEDAIHRGPAQVIPAVRDAIKSAIMNAKPTLFEPVQTIRIDAPAEYLGAISSLIQSRRGQLLDVNQEGMQMVVKAKLPVGEMFGFTDTLRSETEGRAFWSLQDSAFEKIPASIQDETVRKIRQRKGLTENQ